MPVLVSGDQRHRGYREQEADVAINAAQPADERIQIGDNFGDLEIDELIVVLIQRPADVAGRDRKYRAVGFRSPAFGQSDRENKQRALFEHPAHRGEMRLAGRRDGVGVGEPVRFNLRPERIDKPPVVTPPRDIAWRKLGIGALKQL